MVSCRPRQLPHLQKSTVKLKKDDKVSQAVNPIKYQSTVGSLYTAIATHPEEVGVVSKFNAKHNEVHLRAVKRIFHYHKVTVDLSLKKENASTTA